MDTLKTLVALCKRRGFLFPGSDVYGGFANTYSYGPYGAALKKAVRTLWWRTFIEQREDMVGLDGPILLHPRVWEASGHCASFSDALVDCRACKSRCRADHLIEKAAGIDCEGLSLEAMEAIIAKEQIRCPVCQKYDWTKPRHFNLMFETMLSKTGNDASKAFLRPETAQAIFVDIPSIFDTCRKNLPFGVGQIGKAFRNEITPGNFTFRTIEFEQMEIEYLIDEGEWETHFSDWLTAMQVWCRKIGLKEENLSLHEHPPEKLSHYSKRTVDIHYNFPFGSGELYGLAYRTDFDLRQHAEATGKSFSYRDPHTNRVFIPHVIEPTFGLDRTLLALLCDAYDEEEVEGKPRVVLRLHPSIAPVQVAILPLMKKEPLVNLARSWFDTLKQRFVVEYDQSGAIGKRYRRQDEIGTPYCITIDYTSLEDGTVTLRDRDTMQQHRISMDALMQLLEERCLQL